MIQIVPVGFALQSEVVVRCVPVGGGSIAMRATIGSAAGCARLTGLKPERRYLLAGATDSCARTDDAGEAMVTVQVRGPGVVTLVPVI